MKKKIFSTMILLSCVLSINASYAVDKTEELKEIPAFKVQSEQETSCRRVNGYFTRSHYKEVSLDDKQFINKIIVQFLDNADYSHSYLLKSEVDEIYANSEKFKNGVKLCELDYPLEVYNKLLNRRFERYNYYFELLEQPIEFDSDEVKAMDHSKLDYPKDEAELKDLWRLSFKSDFLNLKLFGKTDEKVKELLKKRYKNAQKTIKKTKTEDAFSVFMNAFATAIDPHTSYLSPINTAEFENSMNLSMEGVGAVLRQKEDYIEIVEIVPESPAAKSKKLKPKDLIIGVQQHKPDDNEMVDVVGMSLLEVVPLVKGPKNSKVTLEIQRGKDIFKVDLVRNTIKLEDNAAKGEVKLVDGKRVGVLTVKSFYVDLSKDMKKEIEKLKKSGIDSMVVDLRSNGGGLLSEAIYSTGLFIKSGPVVQVRDSMGEVLSHADTDDNIYYDGSLVVLLDRFSASSSEIFAAALQDYGRAVIVGNTSFGKGTVQRTNPLTRIYDLGGEELGSIHYTIAMYYRINGGSNQKKGVIPNIMFPSTFSNDLVGEAQYANVLEYNQIDTLDFNPYGDLNTVVPILEIKHKERVKDNFFFNRIEERFKQYEEERKANIVSLNYQKRLDEKQKEDDEELEYVNSCLEFQGKKTVKSMKDLPDDYVAPDSFLNEAMKISLDLADLKYPKIKENGKEAKDNNQVAKK